MRSGVEAGGSTALYRVVVCGKSLYLDAITEGLLYQTRFHIVRVDPQASDVLEQICDLAPDAILIESRSSNRGIVFALLQQGFPVIVLDSEESSVTVLKGQHVATPGLADLARVIATMGRESEPQIAAPTQKFSAITASIKTF